jgi:hypothetical protein
MAAMSKWGGYDKNLPGLYSYLSATWGDGLLLPIAAASLVYSIDGLRPAPHETSIGSIVALIGAGGGAATQVAWLHDRSPRLNWTLPHAQHFNGAGWYHAVFLCSAAAAFAALWVTVARRLTSDDIVTRRTLIATSLAGACSVAFAALVQVDNVKAAHSSAATATLLALTGAASVFGLGAATVAVVRRRRQHHGVGSLSFATTDKTKDPVTKSNNAGRIH